MYPGKRLLDLAAVLATAPLWLPLLVLVALVVRARLGSPVFFRQQRPGRHEALFEMIKFRTMNDARDERGQLLPDAERLTPVGRRLRTTSLDELPEVLNVLRGDMSLVGPRPLLPQYLPLYSPRHRLRHTVRPGLTGLAQVNGRNAITWTEKFELDVQYVERATLWLDLRILWQTARAVLGKRGINAPDDATMPVFRGYD